MDGDLTEAFAPMAVTLTVADEIDVSRGDMLLKSHDLPHLNDRFDAQLVWMAEERVGAGQAVPVQTRHQAGVRARRRNLHTAST